jgi:hypothetical protein
MCLYDEEYDVRETAVCLLSRLGEINPAYVMPMLRRVVIEVVLIRIIHIMQIL